MKPEERPSIQDFWPLDTDPVITEEMRKENDEKILNLIREVTKNYGNN